MNFETPRNPNYTATVVRLEKFVDLSGCDNVKGALIFGNQVIVGKDETPGTVGLYFPVETALSHEFLAANNLYRKPEFGNLDPEKKGFFEQHGRVKCMKFRGHKSEGFWIPLTSLEYLGLTLTDFNVGDEFDRIDEHEICRKYIPRRNVGSGIVNAKGRKVRVEDRLVAGQFRFHYDTENLRRNVHKIQPEHYVSITDKWHGTSAIYANVLVSRDLPWYERLLRHLGVRVNETEYAFVCASRRVVKSVAGVEKPGAAHFHDTDIWSEVGAEVRDVIPPGFTIYGEIVGYTKDGAAIQALGGEPYSYGCQPGTHRFLVYRVTFTTQDGRVFELSWQQIKEFCNERGLEHVKELWAGTASEFYPCFYNDARDSWTEGFLRCLEATYVNDSMCPHNENRVPAEGIVVRVDHLHESEAFKLKNFKFLQKESEALDKGVVDIETQETEE